LRCLWGPSRELNQLVRIVDIPIRLYVGTELPIQENLHNALYDRLFFFSEAFIALGFFIFVFGIFNLLIGLFEEEGVVSFWLYKYIRHPQYLGYILWSYGIYARTNMVSNVFGYSRPNPFPWVISTLLIICIALHEENILRTEKSEYLNYSEETSFLVPTPKIVSSLFLYPFRVITKREYPDSIQDIALVFFIYLSIIILISLEASWMLRIET
jgi:hypothetical protein